MRGTGNGQCGGCDQCVAKHCFPSLVLCDLRCFDSLPATRSDQARHTHQHGRSGGRDPGGERAGDLFDLVGVKLLLEDALGRRVDVVPIGGLKTDARDAVLREVRYAA